MTISQRSDFDTGGSSAAFTRLHPTMQRWVYQQGWSSLHDAQEQAIGPILEGQRDVIISAATAAGKTEAAFLPICSALASAREAGSPESKADSLEYRDPKKAETPVRPSGIEVLYLSPLKALINDQYSRLDMLAKGADIVVTPWHGDVSGTAKRKVRDNPSGILLITPESLEALFVNRGTQIAAMFAGLQFVVVDELHSFISTARGAQLQSLLTRTEAVVRRVTPRIGLSATIGDLNLAAQFLRPADPKRVVIISTGGSGNELRLQLRGYRETEPKVSEREALIAVEEGRAVEVEDTIDGDYLAIADHLYRTLRGTHNLVFTNSRRNVELYADLLARRSERDRTPNEFFPHHGSLSKELREDAEAHLKDRSQPATAVCTSTLEMGIDIGALASVAQVGVPPSVASLRQRLGRSGRRDESAVLRVYISEPELTPTSTVAQQLRCSIVQTTAMIQLLLDRWLESPNDPGLNFSTLVQQILSVIAQTGGATAVVLHRLLCGPGPFGQVTVPMFVQLLRAMAAKDLLIQASDGLLLHGEVGERFVNHYSFYAAFATPEEWRLVAGGRNLGTLPITEPLIEGGLLIFGGTRWKISNVDEKARVVELIHAGGGVLPRFGGSGALVATKVRTRMVEVYEATDRPVWMNSEAIGLLEEGRSTWRRLECGTKLMIKSKSQVIVLPWVGDRELFTANLLLSRAGLQSAVEGPALIVLNTRASLLRSVAQQIISTPMPDGVTLARELKNVEIDKWDWVLDNDLAAEATAARRLDINGGWETVRRIAGTESCI